MEKANNRKPPPIKVGKNMHPRTNKPEVENKDEVVVEIDPEVLKYQKYIAQ